MRSHLPVSALAPNFRSHAPHNSGTTTPAYGAAARYEP
jgi:hypothetical protein